jgi:hypothetical protein
MVGDHMGIPRTVVCFLFCDFHPLFRIISLNRRSRARVMPGMRLRVGRDHPFYGTSQPSPNRLTLIES